MTRPIYLRNFAEVYDIDPVDDVPWGTFTDARNECFMALKPTLYTYGSGKGVRTYESVPFQPWVLKAMNALNVVSYIESDGVGLAARAVDPIYSYNVCFLNRYENEKQHLGWHADDSPGMDHDHPIAVLSFGQPREIWWRANDQKGVIPEDQKQLLESGSLFVMRPGFQRTHQHRIPKGDRTMAPRISLTFRHYIEEAP